MANVSSTTTAIRVINGVTQIDVTHTAPDATVTSHTLTVADNATVAQVQAQISADALTWYNVDKWRDDLDTLLIAPIETPVS